MSPFFASKRSVSQHQATSLTIQMYKKRVDHNNLCTYDDMVYLHSLVAKGRHTKLCEEIDS